MYQFIAWVKQHGTATQKIAALDFEFVCSISSFMDLVLHPKVGFNILKCAGHFQPTGTQVRTHNFVCFIFIFDFRQRESCFTTLNASIKHVMDRKLVSAAPPR